MTCDDSELVFAFPEFVRNDVTKVVSTLPQPCLTSHTFSVLVEKEVVRIPYRIYHDVTLIDQSLLNDSQLEFLDCLLSRHHNGFVREASLRRLLSKNHRWVPPFVVQLVGEYVIEILSIIREELDALDHNLYRDFLISNPGFLKLTKQRVRSYWNCYFSHISRNEYCGVQIVKYFDSLVGPSHRSPDLKR